MAGSNQIDCGFQLLVLVADHLWVVADRFSGFNFFRGNPKQEKFSGPTSSRTAAELAAGALVRPAEEPNIQLWAEAGKDNLGLAVTR